MESAAKIHRLVLSDGHSIRSVIQPQFIQPYTQFSNNDYLFWDGKDLVILNDKGVEIKKVDLKGRTIDPVGSSMFIFKYNMEKKAAFVHIADQSGDAENTVLVVFPDGQSRVMGGKDFKKLIETD